MRKVERFGVRWAFGGGRFLLRLIEEALVEEGGTLRRSVGIWWRSISFEIDRGSRHVRNASTPVDAQ